MLSSCMCGSQARERRKNVVKSQRTLHKFNDRKRAIGGAHTDSRRMHRFEQYLAVTIQHTSSSSASGPGDGGRHQKSGLY